MHNQLAFLLCLGAYENQRMSWNKLGITSSMQAFPDNEKLWAEAGETKPLTDAIYEMIVKLTPECLDEAVDGTLFPPEDPSYMSEWRNIIRRACDEVQMRFTRHGDQLKYTYKAYEKNDQRSLLTDEQVEKLAQLSVEFDCYTMNDLGE